MHPSQQIALTFADAVPDIEPGVLDAAGQPVIGARPTECEEVAARLE
jgi:hypothetical protein